MSPSPPSPNTRWFTWPFRLLMLLGACAGFAVVWVVLALSTASQCSWMALLGALDVIWILRLVHWPAGLRRAAVAVVATGWIAVLANWSIIAFHVGQMLGLNPFASMIRLGVRHAWVMAQLANGPIDLVLIGAGLLLALVLAR